MPRYLVSVKYTPETTAAVREAGYASRVEATEAFTASLGGSVEGVHFTTGDWSLHVIYELPSEAVAFAANSAAWAGGHNDRFIIQPLFTAEEADAAIAAKVDYTPPGS